VRASESTGTELVRGVIDLVHRQGDEWRVVDYKTDLDHGPAATKYAEQVRTYGDAWGRIANTAVVTVVVAAR
jgi:ATP-dependent exoDNAse (exonuclease V) beta subunit